MGLSFRGFGVGRPNPAFLSLLASDPDVPTFAEVRLEAVEESLLIVVRSVLLVISIMAVGLFVVLAATGAAYLVPASMAVVLMAAVTTLVAWPGPRGDAGASAETDFSCSTRFDFWDPVPKGEMK